MKQATQSRSKAVSQPATGIKEPVEWDAFASLPAPDSPQQNWDAFGEGVQSSTKTEEPQAACSDFDAERIFGHFGNTLEPVLCSAEMVLNQFFNAIVKDHCQWFLQTNQFLFVCFTEFNRMGKVPVEALGKGPSSLFVFRCWIVFSWSVFGVVQATFHALLNSHCTFLCTNCVLWLHFLMHQRSSVVLILFVE